MQFYHLHWNNMEKKKKKKISSNLFLKCCLANSAILASGSKDVEVHYFSHFHSPAGSPVFHLLLVASLEKLGVISVRFLQLGRTRALPLPALLGYLLVSMLPHILQFIMVSLFLRALQHFADSLSNVFKHLMHSSLLVSSWHQSFRLDQLLSIPIVPVAYRDFWWHVFMSMCLG